MLYEVITPVKVTDMLLKGSKTAVSGDYQTYKKVAEELHQIHYQIIDGLLAPEKERQQILIEIRKFLERFEDLCQAVFVLGELTPRALDAISGMGEQMSARILAACLRERGYNSKAIDATELIVTDDNFQAASPLLEHVITSYSIHYTKLYE